MFLQRFVVVKHCKARHVKSCYPHIHHYCDAEIGIFVFELCVKHLAIRLIAKQVVHFLRFVVLVASGYNVHQWQIH